MKKQKRESKFRGRGEVRVAEQRHRVRCARAGARVRRGQRCFPAPQRRGQRRRRLLHHRLLRPAPGESAVRQRAQKGRKRKRKHPARVSISTDPRRRAPRAARARARTATWARVKPRA